MGTGIVKGILYIAYINVHYGMPKQSTGARFNLGDPWDGNLADFCTAHFNGSATEVVRQALDYFFAARFDAEPAVKARVDEARKKRLGIGTEKIRAIRADDKAT